MLLKKLINPLINYRSSVAFILLLLFCSKDMFAQNKIANPIYEFSSPIDSLQLALKNVKNDSDWVSTFNRITVLRVYSIRYIRGNFDSLSTILMNDALKALRLAQKLNYKKEIARAYGTIGLIYEEQKGDLAEAIRYYFKVLSISEEIGDTACARSQYYSIGRIYYAMGDTSNALKNFFISKKMAKENGDEIYIASCNNFLGKIYSQGRDYTKAMKYFSECLMLAKKINDSVRIAEGYFGISKIYLDKGDFNTALDYQFTVLNIFENSPKIVIKSKSYISIGNVYYKQAVLLNSDVADRKYGQAIQYITKGLQLVKVSTNPGDRDLFLDAYLNLANSYKGLMDYKNALHYTILYSQLKDSIINKQSFAKVKEQQKQYEEEKVAVVDKANQEKLKSEQKHNNTLLMLAVAGIMITSIFMIAFFRQANLKKRAIEKAESVHKIAELELQSLRAQLNPHFMFNSLNAIQELILMEDTERSHTYLSRFSKLVRILLENADQPFISLKKEIDFLQLYLSLENLRVPDMKYSIDSDSKIMIDETFIPNMILQPFIENAIWHGLSHKKSDKELDVRIYRQNGTVNYEIEDNGIGRKKSAELKSLFRQKHQSKGMELLSKRFKLLNEEYGSDIKTTISDVIKNNEIAGTLVTIKVPVNLTKQFQT
jgi:tetratricopeptide (TPR) repeat protein